MRERDDRRVDLVRLGQVEVGQLQRDAVLWVELVEARPASEREATATSSRLGWRQTSGRRARR